MVSKTNSRHTSKKATQELTERTMSKYGRPPMAADYAKVIERQKKSNARLHVDDFSRQCQKIALQCRTKATQATSTIKTKSTKIIADLRAKQKTAQARKNSNPAPQQRYFTQQTSSYNSTHQTPPSNTSYAPQPNSTTKAQPAPITSTVARQSPTRTPRSATTLKSSKTLKKHSPTWSECTLIGIISLSALCIGAALIVDYSFNPERDAINALEQLAKDYYVEYLYPNTLGNYADDPAKILSSYVDQGYPTTRLRQLLHYNNDAKISMSKYFDNTYYLCNKNTTTLRFFPVAPYGPNDYTVTYSYDCQDLRKNSAQATSSSKTSK